MVILREILYFIRLRLSPWRWYVCVSNYVTLLLLFTLVLKRPSETAENETAAAPLWLPKSFIV